MLITEVRLDVESVVEAGVEEPWRRKETGDPVRDSVPYMLQIAARRQTASFMASLVGTGVHPAESYVVHELWKESPQSQTQLSARLDINNATVGKTLQRLERNGFVTRSRTLGDRRHVMVRLTEKGHAAHALFDAATKALIEEIDLVLGRAEAQRLLAALTKLATHFQGKPAVFGGETE
jgi:DNA-binding MarR family transcriptional regulator